MKYRNLIGGDWVDARSGGTFANINPADTSDVIGEFCRQRTGGCERVPWLPPAMPTHPGGLFLRLSALKSCTGRLNS